MVIPIINPDRIVDFNLFRSLATHDMSKPVQTARTRGVVALDRLSDAVSRNKGVNLKSDETRYISTLLESLTTFIGFLQGSYCKVLDVFQAPPSPEDRRIVEGEKVSRDVNNLRKIFLTKLLKNGLEGARIKFLSDVQNIEIKNTLPKSIKFDVNALFDIGFNRIVYNLLYNAFEHTPDDKYGGIGIELKLDDDSKVNNGDQNYLVISVINPGNMSDKRLEDLLNTSREGLKIIDEFTRKLGGELVLENDSSSVVKFTVKLPVKLVVN